MISAFRPLIVYQAPWDWEFLWNRAQPLAMALEAQTSVVYVGCGITSFGRIGGLLRRIPLLRTWVEKHHWGYLSEARSNLWVARWAGLRPDPWYCIGNERPRSAYCWLGKTVRRLAVGSDAVWLLTSRPQVRGLLDLYNWDRVLVDLEDPWLSLSWSALIPEQTVIDLLRRADVVFANGPMIAKEYSGRSGRDVIDLPNGIDPEFLKAITGPLLPIPNIFALKKGSCKAVFTGNFNDRIDVRLLLSAATACPIVDFIFVGLVNRSGNDQQEMDSLRSLPNVSFVPAIPHSAIPAVLQHADVLLLPYAHFGSELMFPAKLYEYAAAAKPVLTTLDFGLGKSLPPSLRVCQTAEEFIAELGAVADRRWTISAATRDACQSVAAANTWYTRAERILAVGQRGSVDAN